MDAVVEIRNVKIGEGLPKICVPVTAKTKKEIWKEAEELKNHPFDMVEWRADFFEGLADPEEVQEVLKELRKILGEAPLLFHGAERSGRRKRPDGYGGVSSGQYAGCGIRNDRSGGCGNSAG